MIYAITGGSGSLGTALVHHLLAEGHKVRALARNEHRLAALKESVDPSLRGNLSILCGSVTDRYRLLRAFSRADYVIHAAAMKSVPQCEYDPGEAVKINIEGTQLVAECSIDTGVKRAVFISSDKACSPHNLYGMTKATGERLWLACNRYSAGIGTEFVAVRYGNVWGSNGSVIRKWIATNGGGISITHPECTRFHLRLPDALALVLSALRGGCAGSLYVPLLPSYRLRDVAEAFQEGTLPEAQSQVKYIGLQPGEKLHECMVNEHEAAHAVREGDRIRIDPSLRPGDVIPQKDGVRYEAVTEYTSGRNEWRLSVEELRKEIEWLRST